jgi:hypothetical protein
MAKLLTIIGIMSGITLLFYYGGVLTDTVNTTLLSMLLNPESFQTADLILKTLASAGLVVGASTLLLRAFGGPGAELYFMLGFVYLFFSFGYDFLSIYQQIAAYSAVGQVIGVLLLGPLMVMYVMAVVEWWRGVEA